MERETKVDAGGEERGREGGCGPQAGLGSILPALVNHKCGFGPVSIRPAFLSCKSGGLLFGASLWWSMARSLSMDSTLTSVAILARPQSPPSAPLLVASFSVQCPAVASRSRPGAGVFARRRSFIEGSRRSAAGLATTSTWPAARASQRLVRNRRRPPS